ncbi:MAG TPA: TetR family transcriptional regulator C-terminal domain-containing protein [Solirubrobacteraceae bacterium]|nr:TetR family transcriptional regulator C-terminal domain-containing protein [Solirubrobacteraceae bacterium]
MRDEYERPTPTDDVPSRRPLAKVRQPQILAAAVELLREQGLWNVRVADVAERAGTSATGVIYYFGTKHDLFRAAISDADAEFYASVWPELDRLESAVDRLAWLVVRSSRSEWVLWMDLWVYARRHPDLIPTHRGFSERWCATIAGIVRHGQERGEFAQVDPDAVAARLAALMDGLAIHMVNEDPGRTPAHYVEMSLTAAAAELGCDVQALLDAAAAVPET